MNLASKGLDLCFFWMWAHWSLLKASANNALALLAPLKLGDNDKDKIMKYKRKSCGGGGSQRGGRMREIICQLSGNDFDTWSDTS